MATVALTDKAIAAAKADAGKRVELWDARTPGLCVRISGEGKKAFYYRYRTADGRQPRLKLGDYSQAFTLADARRRVDRIKIEVQDGGDPAAEKRRARSEARAQPLKTMEQLAETYFAACESGEWKPRNKRKRESTLAEERGLWKRHLAAEMGAMRIEEVTSHVVRKRLREILAAGKGVTSNRVRSLLRQVFNFAIAERRVSANPVMETAALGTEKARARVLSDDELRALWSALETPGPFVNPDSGAKVYVGAAVRIATRLLALTLTRRSEVAGMRRDELDLRQASWVIPGERTKNGRPHLVPLSPEAVDLIEVAVTLADEDKEKKSPYVFPNPRDRSRPMTAGAISHALRNLCPAIGLVNATPHDLRRTAATNMASERLKVPPHLIGRLLNHSGERGGAATVTIEHYALHDYASEKRVAVNGWGQLLREIRAAASTDQRSPSTGDAIAHG